jgi:hypothetical protein
MYRSHKLEKPVGLLTSKVYFEMNAIPGDCDVGLIVKEISTIWGNDISLVSIAAPQGTVAGWDTLAG